MDASFATEDDLLCEYRSSRHIELPPNSTQVHSMCDASRGECRDTLAAVNEEMGRSTGCPLNVVPQPPRPAGATQFPLAASCAFCEQEETATKRLKQCTRCKVTRYCGSVKVYMPESCAISDVRAFPVLIVKSQTGDATNPFAMPSRMCSGYGIERI